MTLETTRDDLLLSVIRGNLAYLGDHLEDSRSGLLAATAAGVRCVVVVSSFTQAEDFSEAILAVTSLGAPGGEQTHVIANRGRARPGDYITLRDLADCLAS